MVIRLITIQAKHIQVCCYQAAILILPAQTFGDSRTQGRLRERKPGERAPLRAGEARDQSGTRPRHSRPVQDSAAATRRSRCAMVRACVQAWSAHPSTSRGGRQGRRRHGARGGPRRWGRTGAQALTHRQAKHAEQVLQGQHGKAARHVEDSGGGAQSGLMHTAQAADALPGHLLPGAGAVDLGSVDGQAGQGEVAAHGGAIAPPALLLQSPALLEFAVRVILDVPAGPIRLQGGKAVRERGGC